MMRAMVVATLVLWAAGCQEKEHYPPGEGGGPGAGGGSDSTDAGIDAGSLPDGGGPDGGTPGLDGAVALGGRLCNVTDVRDPLDPIDCADTADLGGIEVVEVVSGQSDDTDAEGRFDVTFAFDDGRILAVGRDDLTTRDALVPVDGWRAATFLVPRIAQSTWDALMTELGEEQVGTASIALFLRDGGVPVQGADVLSDPDAPRTFYDDAAVLALWSEAASQTGPFGAALLLDVPADVLSEVNITVGAASFDLPIQADHLTLARVDL
jgi:hypothetical protein